MMHVRILSLNDILWEYLLRSLVDMLVEQRDPDTDPEVWDGWTWRDRLQETQDSARQDDAASHEGLSNHVTMSPIG